MLRRKPLAEGQEAHDTSGIPHGVLFQVAVVLREDTNQWAFPGGKVNDGELVGETFHEKFTKKAGAHDDPLKLADFEDALDEVFTEGGREIFRGYVDDPRNTDNAWVESTVYLFYITDDLAARLELSSGSEVASACWLDIDAELLSGEVGKTLYADHKDWLLRALEQERKYLCIPDTELLIGDDDM